MVIVSLPDALADDRRIFDFRHDFERSNHTQTNHSLLNETQTIEAGNRTMDNATIELEVKNSTVEPVKIEPAENYSATPAVNETIEAPKPQLHNSSRANRVKNNETKPVQKANITNISTINSTGISTGKNVSVHSLWFQITLQNSSNNETPAIVIRDSPAQKQNFISRLLKWFSRTG
jgi:hypothetical protein